MTPADAAGCERAAIRAYLLGADDESAKHWEKAARAALTQQVLSQFLGEVRGHISVSQRLELDRC